jgi:nucleotide sugar dehydrogenase
MVVAIIGLGYVGLPLAVLAAKKGNEVIGYDLDKSKIESLKNGKSPVQDVSNGELAKLKNFSPTSYVDDVSGADIIIICVPTPVEGRNPDLGPVRGAVRDVSQKMKPGTLLIIESTINPGVCDDVVIPLAEEASGMKVNKDFFVAHCPERINPGDPKWNVSNINRVVGGSNDKALKMAVDFYESIIDAEIKPMGNLKEAEACKVVENSFRDINIAFVNELARSFQRMGINVENVIEGAATKPFAFMAHHPSAGVGGHCIPVDPYYLIEYARGFDFNHDFLSLARRINEDMPEFAVELLQDELNKIGKSMSKSKVALLGLSYKPNVNDDRESPSYHILELLRSKGCEVRVFDPHILSGSTVKTIEEALKGADAVFVATPHNDFSADLKPENLAKRNIGVVLDGKNKYRQDKLAYESKGIAYRGIGI